MCSREFGVSRRVSRIDIPLSRTPLRYAIVAFDCISGREITNCFANVFAREPAGARDERYRAYGREIYPPRVRARVRTYTRCGKSVFIKRGYRASAGERRRAARPVRYDVSGVQLFSTIFFTCTRCTLKSSARGRKSGLTRLSAVNGVRRGRGGGRA